MFSDLSGHALVRITGIVLFTLLGCSSQAPLAVIPFDLQRNLPMVEVDVNGISTRLMLDLGADVPIALTEKEIAAVGAQVLDERIKYGMADGSVFEVPLIQVSEVKLDTWTRLNVRGHLFRFRQGTYEDSRTGHIGTALFRGKLLVVDYPKRQFLVFPSDSRISCPKNWVDIDVSEGVPRIHVVIEGKDVSLGWDTGSQHNVVRPGILENPSKVSFRLGNNIFEDQTFEIHELQGTPFDMVLGYEFFAENVVCFDFGKNKLAVRKS